MFFADVISGLRDFTQHLTFGVHILTHSADACILVMACVDYARACSKYILLDVLLCSIAEYFYDVGRILASP